MSPCFNPDPVRKEEIEEKNLADIGIGEGKVGKIEHFRQQRERTETWQKLAVVKEQLKPEEEEALSPLLPRRPSSSYWKVIFLQEKQGRFFSHLYLFFDVNTKLTIYVVAQDTRLNTCKEPRACRPSAGGTLSARPRSSAKHTSFKLTRAFKFLKEGKMEYK